MFKSMMSRFVAAVLIVSGLVGHSYAQTAGPVTGVQTGAYYNYVPTTIRVGSQLQIWWCGLGPSSDNIYYQSINVDTQQYGPIKSVLQPTPGAWDSLHTCDPSVVRGSWKYEGATYTYAMYYTATDDGSNEGATNGVGVAYSNDGINWVKYPFSIYRTPPTNPRSYGIGQQTIINADGKSAIYAIINDVKPGSGPSTWTYFYSADGLNFEKRGVLTTGGMITPAILQADFAYDYQSSYMYMATDRANDQSKIDVYRIPVCNLTKANASWQHLVTYSSATTGQAYNQGPGFLRNEFGNNTPFLPTLVTYFASGPVANTNTQTKIWSAASTVTAPPAAQC